jgi:hypothetical protein
MDLSIQTLKYKRKAILLTLREGEAAAASRNLVVARRWHAKLLNENLLFGCKRWFLSHEQ